MNLFKPDFTPLIIELQQFKNQQAQIITLLQENNQLLKQLLQK